MAIPVGMDMGGEFKSHGKNNAFHGVLHITRNILIYFFSVGFPFLMDRRSKMEEAFEHEILHSGSMSI